MFHTGSKSLERENQLQEFSSFHITNQGTGLTYSTEQSPS